MSAEVITFEGLDYVLIPHFADWSQEPRLSRRWSTKVATGITGAEDRARVSGPIDGLRWSVTSNNEQEEARIDGRMVAAKFSGRAAAPWFGRGMRIVTAASGAGTVTVESTPWLPVAGDWIILLTRADASQPLYDAREVASVAGNIITITGTLSRTYTPGTLCYQLIIGTFTGDQRPSLRAEMGSWTFSIETERPASIETEGTPPIIEEPVEPPYGIWHGRVGMDAAAEFITTEADLEDPQKLFWGGLRIVAGMRKLTYVEQEEVAGTFAYTCMNPDFIREKLYTGESSAAADAPWGPIDVVVEQFDSSVYGTPLSVDVLYTLIVHGSPRMENVVYDVPDSANAQISGDAGFGWPPIGFLSASMGFVEATAATGLISFPGYDGTLDYGGLSGITVEPAISGFSSGTVTIDSSSPEWASLIGSGDAAFIAESANPITVAIIDDELGDVAFDVINQSVDVSVATTWHYHPLEEGYWVFAIADTAPWSPASFTITMASLADLGGPAANRGEINGFGYEKVEDFDSKVFKLFRSLNSIPPGDASVTVT